MTDNWQQIKMKNNFILAMALIITLSTSNNVRANGLLSKGDNPFVYYTSITAWSETTESKTYYIFYKEGNGERKYVVFHVRELDDCPFCGYEDIYYNGCYQDANCNDFRKNYQYKTIFPDGMTYYFNCNLPYREKSKYPYTYYANITAWYEATEFKTYYIFYKEGNGQRKYIVFPYRNIEECERCGYDEVLNNDYYRSPQCHDYRKNYRYKYESPGGMTYYFNCNL